MKTIGILLGFIQRLVGSADKTLDMLDNVLEAGVYYSSEVKADAAHACSLSASARADEIKLLTAPKK